MILMGQANAWYANKPESSLIEDIKRKIAIAVLLLSPNIAVIGGGLIMVAQWSTRGCVDKTGHGGRCIWYPAWSYLILIVFLGGILMLIYSICFCCKKLSKNKILSLIKTNLSDNQYIFT